MGQILELVPAGAPVPTLAMNDREMLWFALQKLRETVERDGPNDGASGSSSVGKGPVLEMECVICTEMRPYTSFISTTGERCETMSESIESSDDLIEYNMISSLLAQIFEAPLPMKASLKPGSLKQ